MGSTPATTLHLSIPLGRGINAHTTPRAPARQSDVFIFRKFTIHQGFLFFHKLFLNHIIASKSLFDKRLNRFMHTCKYEGKKEAEKERKNKERKREKKECK